MSSLRLLLFSLVLLHPIVSASARAGVTALKIVDKTYDPTSRELSYEMWNASDQVITAWRLSLVVEDANGQAERAVLDQDFYMNLPVDSSATETRNRVSRSQGPIYPGETFSAIWKLESPAGGQRLQALSLQVRAVLFSSLQGEGESDAVEALFAARRVRVEELGRLLEIIERRRANRMPRAELASVLRMHAERLRQPIENPMESGALSPSLAVLSATRIELADWLEAASTEVVVAAYPDLVLDRLRNSLQRQRDLGRGQVSRNGGTTGSAGEQP